MFNHNSDNGLINNNIYVFKGNYLINTILIYKD